MKLIVAGTRTLNHYPSFCRAIDMFRSIHHVDLVIHGGARGVDSMAGRWAEENGVAVDCHPADWEKLGRKAGILRNIDMAEIGEALLALWDGKSRGTMDMILRASAKGMIVMIFYCRSENGGSGS